MAKVEIKLKQMNKLLVAAGSTLALAGWYTQDGVLDLNEIITLVISALTAYGVYQVPNKPEGNGSERLDVSED